MYFIGGVVGESGNMRLKNQQSSVIRNGKDSGSMRIYVSSAGAGMLDISGGKKL